VPQVLLGALPLSSGWSLLLLGGWHSSRFEVQASALLPKSLDIPEQLADLGTAGGTCQSAAGGSCL
jgi:hypothetical protein